MTPELPDPERHQPKHDDYSDSSVFLDVDEADTVPAVPSEKRRKYLEERYGRPVIPPGAPPTESSGQNRK